MASIKEKETLKKDRNAIKVIYKQIREGCKRKICYNIYCHNNLISSISKLKYNIYFKNLFYIISKCLGKQYFRRIIRLKSIK